MTKEENKKKLGTFLRELADEIDSKDTPKALLKHTSEFFISCQFVKQAIADGHDDHEEKTVERSDIEKFVKFIMLGWYCYTLIESGETIPNASATENS